MKNHYQILIVGGGNAGISVASKLHIKNKSLDIGIIDPSEKHYYQPAWTLVGAGVFDIKDTERNESEQIPKNADWIKDSVIEFSPEQNTVTLKSNQKISYNFLVVAAGIQLNWNEIKGLADNLGKNSVTSNYNFKTAPYTYELLKNIKIGKAIFHNPNTIVKCGGAPHKIMYLAADYFRKHNLQSSIKIEYWSGGSKLFAVPKYEKTLLKVVKRGNIALNFNQKLIEIDGAQKKAKFIGIGNQNKGQETWVDFDMIHVTPPQSAPDFIKNSSIANPEGWVEVDKETLQHPRYKNIFTLGDSAGLPTSKTGAAIRKQAPVLVNNLISFMNNKPLTDKYNGYSSCPVVTGYGKLVLAEFDYNGTPTETFPFDQSKERWSIYFLKKNVLPWLYWNKILTGQM
jgi:sulfide:quinone oxidoreductase